jgi:CTD small phosphatase-like protein 2
LIPPFLPPIKDYEYSLVLDLDETLVHFIDSGNNRHLLVRPFVSSFLNEMSKIYELVIFTAGLENYANWFR